MNNYFEKTIEDRDLGAFCFGVLFVCLLVFSPRESFHLQVHFSVLRLILSCFD